MRNISKIAGLLAASTALHMTACVTNPYTGRSQLLMSSAADESQLGAQAYRQIKSDPNTPISRDPREIEPVRRVALRVIEAAKKSRYADLANQFEWEVTVFIADKTVNAFALPGGKIGIYTGVFPAAQNEAGLAAIMGHEVVHALARHGAERMSQNQLAQLGLGVAGAALGQSGASPAVSQNAMAALGLGAQVGVLLPFGRAHESEADHIGLLLAAEAGYDPYEAVHVWERMRDMSGGAGQPEFLSTHPADDTRIQQLQSWMKEALAVYQPRPNDTNSPLPRVGSR